MNKIISLMVLILLFCGVNTFSQIYVPVNPTVYGVNELRHRAFLAEHIPEKTSLVTNTNDTTSQIFLLKSDSSVWAYYKPRGFFKIGSGGGGFALDSIYVYDLIDTNMSLHPGHVSIFVSHLILDSLKHKFIDTGARMRNGYVLSFDSTNKKWVMITNGGSITQDLQSVTNIGYITTNPIISNVQLAVSGGSSEESINLIDTIAHHSIGLQKNGIATYDDNGSLWWADISGRQVYLTEDSISPSGTGLSKILLPVGSGRLVTSVNTVAPDIHGNVTISTGGGGTTLANFYLKDSSISGNRTVGIGSNTLIFKNISSGNGVSIDNTEINLSVGGSSIDVLDGSDITINSNGGGIVLSELSGNSLVISSSGIITSSATNLFQGTTWDFYDGGSTHYFQVTPSGINIEGQYLLPTTDGSINQIIRTDGGGTTTWVTSDTTMITNFWQKVRSLLSATSPVIYNNATGVFSIQAMDATHAGYVIAGSSSGKILHGDGTWKDTTAVKSGTVTNVTGSLPIIITSTSTITPNVTLDTGRLNTQIPTGYDLNKVRDSLQNNVTLKVNISDTSSMLTPYLRKFDTTNMLLPYLRKVDTANIRFRPVAGTNITITGSYPTMTFNSTAPLDTVPMFTFSGGGSNAGDTSAFTTSTIYGSFFNSGSDTIVVTRMQIGLQGTSPSVSIDMYWNDSLNITAGAVKLVTAGSTATNIYTGTSVTSFDNFKIPPGVWVWCKTNTVTTKPTYMTTTLIAYKKPV